MTQGLGPEVTRQLVHPREQRLPRGEAFVAPIGLDQDDVRRSRLARQGPQRRPSHGHPCLQTEHAPLGPRAALPHERVRVLT